MNSEGRNALKRRDFFIDHEVRSSGKPGWYQWVFDKAIDSRGIKEDMPVIRVADAGGGDGGFWRTNSKFVPAHWHITVLENTASMLEVARKELADLRCGIEFVPHTLSATEDQAIEYDVEWLREQTPHSYHAVFALHVLQARKSPYPLLSAARHILRRNGGILFVSLPGSDNLSEVQRMLCSLECGWIYSPESTRLNFKAGNGVLQEYFPTTVDKREYVHHLKVDDPDAVVEYVKACDGDARLKLEGERLALFKERLRSEIKKGKAQGQRGMSLTAKSTLFLCRP